MTTGLQFEQFDLERAAFEVKFSPSLLHWDQAGATWVEFLSGYPDFKLARGEPNKTVFTQADAFQCSITLDSALVLASFPDRDEMKVFSGIAEKFTSIVFRSLRITELVRIGLRLTYFWQSKSKGEASDALLATSLLRAPDSKEFGVEGQVLLPKYSVRSEGKPLGITVRLEAQERTFNLEAAFGTKAFETGTKRFKTVTHVESGVVLDCDIFTTAPTPVGAFLAGDWINQSAGKIKRGAASLFRG